MVRRPPGRTPAPPARTHAGGTRPGAHRPAGGGTLDGLAHRGPRNWTVRRAGPAARPPNGGFCAPPGAARRRAISPSPPRHARPAAIAAPKAPPGQGSENAKGAHLVPSGRDPRSAQSAPGWTRRERSDRYVRVDSASAFRDRAIAGPARRRPWPGAGGRGRDAIGPGRAGRPAPRARTRPSGRAPTAGAARPAPPPARPGAGRRASKRATPGAPADPRASGPRAGGRRGDQSR
jgi:hypothetical protein